MSRVLVLSYDGILEPLGESQVLAYLERLAGAHEITLVSYEKGTDWADAVRVTAARGRAARAGIEWVALRYHKRPTVLATAYDLACGLLQCLALVRRRRIEVVHARSYVPALLALVLKRLAGIGFIFDMRGFWPDEKVAADEWREGGALYRAAKWCERRFLLAADVVVSLTHSAVEAMRGFPYLRGRAVRFEVIPTCADLGLFRANARNGGARPFTLGYVGSVGGRYRFDAVLDCFAALLVLRPEAQLRVINRGSHAAIREALRARGVPESCVGLSAEDRVGVARALRQVDAGVFFYRAGFSTLGTAPTRLGELLASGVPCLTNAGVGDVERLLGNEGVGVVLREFTPAAQVQAVRRLVELAAQPGIRQRCAEVAAHTFSLDHATERYDRLYRLFGPDEPSPVHPPDAVRTLEPSPALRRTHACRA